MEIFQKVLQFFQGFTVLSAVMLLLGFSLVIIEMFRSSGRILGVSGGILIAAGTIVRMLGGGSAMTLFVIVFFVCFVMFVANMAVLRFQKRGWLYQSLHLATMAQKQGFETGEYEFLVGQFGMATTDIGDDGNMTLDDVVLPVRSEQYIERGARVRVTAVDGGTVYVSKEEQKVTYPQVGSTDSVGASSQKPRTQGSSVRRTTDKVGSKASRQTFGKTGSKTSSKTSGKTSGRTSGKAVGKTNSRTSGKTGSKTNSGKTNRKTASKTTDKRK